MFNIQRSFENSLRFGSDSPVNLKNRKNPEQHKNCTGKVHGTGKYEKTSTKFCDKSITKKSKSSSLSSENCSDTDESKKSETDSIKVENEEDEGIWVSRPKKSTKSEEIIKNNKKSNNDFQSPRRLSTGTKLTPVKENEKNSLRKFSSPSPKLFPNRYDNVLSRVGSFRKKKLPEISYDEIINLALHRKSRKISENGHFLNLEELIKNSENSKVVNDFLTNAIKFLL